MPRKTGEPPDESNALGEFIRSQRELANLSLRRLAELAEISNPYLSQIERGMYKPSGQVLKAVADALEVSAETMYSRAGLWDEDSSATSNGVEDAIRLDKGLTKSQKAALLEVYKGFIGSQR
jgi:transcriptional regulator with XRE-family HTH domain